MTRQRHAKELRAEGAATGVGDSANAADLASLDATVIDHRRRGSCWQGEGPGRPVICEDQSPSTTTPPSPSTLMQDEHRPCAFADDEVALPMAGLAAAFNGLRTIWIDEVERFFATIEEGRGLPHGKKAASRTPMELTSMAATPPGYRSDIRPGYPGDRPHDEPHPL